VNVQLNWQAAGRAEERELGGCASRRSRTVQDAEGYHQQYLYKVPNGYCPITVGGVSCPVGILPAWINHGHLMAVVSLGRFGPGAVCCPVSYWPARRISKASTQ
jgi:hypothetical protein